jgi:hypothetical protein
MSDRVKFGILLGLFIASIMLLWYSYTLAGHVIVG